MIDWLIDFNDMLIDLGLFDALMLEEDVHCTFVFTFLYSFFRSLELSYIVSIISIWYEYIANGCTLIDWTLTDTIIPSIRGHGINGNDMVLHLHQNGASPQFRVIPRLPYFSFVFCRGGNLTLLQVILSAYSKLLR